MQPRFPLPDVTITQVPVIRSVKAPLYADDYWQLNQTEFAMQVEGIGSFYACNGEEVEYSPLPSATQESVELYLNGSVYGAILHQRKILPLHGSCFIEQGTGVMLCGESGSGKSSLTTAFCMNGAEFLTDDVTPIVFENKRPFILALSDRIKLWKHTLEQLEIESDALKRIDNNTDKFYYPLCSGERSRYPLNYVFILGPDNVKEITFREIKGAEKVISIRNEIYRWEYLQGMKENEIILFSQLNDLCKSVRIISVKRPQNNLIEELRFSVSNYIRYDVIS